MLELLSSRIRDADRPRELEVGPFELKLLASINALRGEAWGSKLLADLSLTLDRDVAIGQLYLALGKLERKGMISSTIKDPEPKRGGRSKKVYRLEAPGVRALDRTAALFATSGAPNRLGSLDDAEVAT